jgi:hypothetical protein
MGMGLIRTAYKILAWSLKGKGHETELGIDRRIISKHIVEKQCEAGKWMELAKDRPNGWGL